MKDVAARLAARIAVTPAAPVRSHVDEVLARFDEVEAKLVAKGWPATSPWWRETIERWYRSLRRELIGRVGRRGGKSSTLSRLAVVEALYGQHVVPPGDMATVAIVSTDKAEALGRLHTIEKILEALDVPFEPSKSPKLGVKLKGRNVEFRVFAATIKGVSGFTGIFVICDELAKWRDADTGVNPATTVLASVRPTMATQPNARAALISSPMGRFDAHFDAFEEGETERQVVAHAPTWVANPTITEAQTHRDEPDEATHAREYGAIPQAGGELSLLTEHLIDRGTRAIVQPPRPVPSWWEEHDAPKPERGWCLATMDPATRGNAWTLVVATRDEKGVRRALAVREKRGSPSEPLSPLAVFQEWAPMLRYYGISVILTDQWAVDALQDSARACGLYLQEEPWSTSRKAEAYDALLKHAQNAQLELPDAPNVKNDLLGIVKKLTRNGVTYELRTTQDGRHSDFAPAIAMAVVHADAMAPPEPPKKTAEEVFDEGKRQFLEGRRRDRERSERLGAPPPTHRRMR